VTLLDLFPDRSESGGTTTLTIPADWNSWQGRHGGLVAGLAAEVAAATWPGAAVKAVTAHFGRQSDEGAFSFAAVTRRAGRVVQIVDVTAAQAGTEVMTATVTLAAESPEDAGQWFAVPAPASLPADRCPNFEFDRRFLPVGAHLDIRPCGGSFPLTAASHPWMLAWVGVVPEVAISPGAAVLMCDLAPGVYPLLTAPVAAPTVEMTVHLCAELGSAPGTGPGLASQRNSATSRNWSVDDTSLWDAGGRLIAQARQVRRIIGGMPAG
jgi:Thioesterase-like superfamily